ncbi:MAG TPA: TIR domain-containing protein [Polyangia bacterium]|nr:TIR domain-containing protein [Polyangia bacterium]
MSILTAGPYKAFISYSWEDRKIARALQQGLQAFAKPYYALRSCSIFLDSADLAATEAIWPSIERALDRSEYLILVACPASAASPWVSREIAHWRKRHDGRLARVLVCVTAGQLVWQENDFAWPASTALDQNVRGGFVAQPRWTELGWARDEPRLTLRDPRFTEVVADLASILHGRAKRDLIGEDVAQHRRFQRLRRAAIAGLILLGVLAASAAGVAEWQRRQAVAERNLAQARLLAASAQTLLAGAPEGIDEAAAAAAAASGVTRTSEGTQALRQAVRALPAPLAHTPCVDGAEVLAAASAGTRLAASRDRRSIVVCDQTGAEIATRRSEERIDMLALEGEGRALAAIARIPGALRVAVWPLPAGSVRTLEVAADAAEIDLVGGGALVVARVHPWNKLVYRLDGRELPLPRPADARFVWDAVVSPDARHVAWVASNKEESARVWDVIADRPLAMEPWPGKALAYSPNGQWLAVASSRELRLIPTSSWHAQAPVPISTVASRPLLAFSASGDALVLVDGESLRLWEIPSLKQLGSAPVHSGYCLGVALAPQGDLLALIEPASVRVFSLPAFRELARKRLTGGRAAHGFAFAPDGRTLLLPRFRRDGVLDPIDGTILKRVAPGDEYDRWKLAGGDIAGIGISASEDLVALADRWGRLEIRRLSGQQLALFTVPDGYQTGPRRAPVFDRREERVALLSERVVLAGPGKLVPEIRVWDWGKRKLLLERKGSWADFAWDPAGRLTVLSIPAALRRFTFGPEGVDREEVLTVRARPLSDRAPPRLALLRPDGSEAAVKSQLLTISTAEPASGGQADESGLTAPEHSTAAWSTDGRWLVLGSKDRPTLVIEPRTGQQRELGGPGSAEQAIAIDPEQGLLAGHGRAGTAVWRLSDGALVDRLGEVPDAGALAFVPHHRLLARAEGAEVAFYRLDPAELRREVCRRVEGRFSLAAILPGRPDLDPCPDGASLAVEGPRSR